MIRLSLKHENYWLDLIAGVRVQVRPLDMPVYQAALAAARQETLKLFPLVTVEELALQDGIMREATFSANFALALARYGILAWEGVGGDDGKALDVSPETVAALMRVPAVGGDFLVKYSSSAAAVVVEGNA